jgi:YcxB-like protein
MPIYRTMNQHLYNIESSSTATSQLDYSRIEDSTFKKFKIQRAVFCLVGVFFHQTCRCTFSYTIIYLRFGFCLIAGVPAAVCSMAKKNYTQDPKIGEATNYEFDEAGIQLIKESGQSKWAWDEVYGVSECNDWILIWESAEGAHVIPTKALAENELETLRGMLNAQRESRKKLKRQRLIELINTQNSQPR